MFYCKTAGSHQHSTIEEAKACPEWASIFGRPTAPPPAPTRPVFGSRSNPDGPLSSSQYSYIRDLKGDTTYAMGLTYMQASDYITSLIEAKKGAMTATPPAPPAPLPPDPRLIMIETLIPTVPEGYYGVPSGRGTEITFIKYSRPTTGKYKDTLKFSQVIGSGGWSSYRLELRAVQWRPGRWSHLQDWFKDVLLNVCADYQTAAMTYAEHIGRCCRCNAVLTDRRSRWYGIGPECEMYRPQQIELVNDSEKGPFRG